MDFIWSKFYCEWTRKVTLKSIDCARANLTFRLLLGVCLILWVTYNGGLIESNDNTNHQISLKIKEGVATNYSSRDFNETYVNEYEWHNYNRPWDSPDIVKIFNHEIHVTTNLVITANQTKSSCPEHSLIVGVLCEQDNDCVPGMKRPHGYQTGRCVHADFPYQNQTTLNWTRNISTCEINGKLIFKIIKVKSLKVRSY